MPSLSGLVPSRCALGLCSVKRARRGVHVGQALHALHVRNTAAWLWSLTLSSDMALSGLGLVASDLPKCVQVPALRYCGPLAQLVDVGACPAFAVNHLGLRHIQQRRLSVVYTVGYAASAVENSVSALR